MSEVVSYRLWCIFEGDSNPFYITASTTTFIDNLKGEIKAAKSNSLQRIDASSLTLWKPLEVIPVKPSKNLAERIGDLGQDFSQFSEQLDPTDSVSEVFQNPNQDLKNPRLDIIVQVPAQILGEPSRAAGEPKQTDFPWLEELHSKIWKREDLRLQIFRKVKVTRADYVALQKRLRELHSDRDSSDYDGTKSDVLSVKLDFLQSLTPVDDDCDMGATSEDDDSEAMSEDDDSEAMSEVGDQEVGNGVDDPEARSEVDDPEVDYDDNFELRLLFPSILSFLDFSTLKLEKDLPIHFPLPLLLRQEYKHISELIENQPQNSGGSVIVTGQPGTGKTAYLYLRVIENMIEGRTFLYQAREGTVYHVSEKGVEVARSWSSKESITAFVDGDEGDYKPDKVLLRHSVQLIVASPPKGANKKWIKQIGHASHITKLVIKLWSYEELILTGIFLHSTDLTHKMLYESSIYFGYDPRRCLGISSVAKLDDQKSELTSLIRDVARKRDLDEIMQLLLNTRTGASDVSYEIFHIFPSDTNENRLLSDYQVNIVSRWALDILMTELETQSNRPSLGHTLRTRY